MGVYHLIFAVDCTDIELYVDIIDCELTIAIEHLSLRHHFTHVTSGRYFWLYTTLTVSEVAKVLLWHINSLLLTITSYWLVEIWLATSLGSFPKEVTVIHCQLCTLRLFICITMASHWI